jgi:hypothetical protein
MDDTKSMGLRLPMQAAVDRTATHATLADGTGMEASAAGLSQLPQNWQQLFMNDFANPPIAVNGFANPLF